MTENEIAKIVVDLCVKIHKILGPGLLESVYEAALVYELKKLGIPVSRTAFDFNPGLRLSLRALRLCERRF